MKKDNVGVNTLNGSAADLAHKTVLVLGAGRGGTSMVAGTLSKLGIYMGESLSSYYEDGVLANCLSQNDKQLAKTIIKERNDKYSMWGFKKPSLRLWLWLNLFREPVYVVVFRDVFATANRRVISLDKSLFSEMLKVVFINLGLVILLRFSKRPVFLLSYEKALLDPERFVTELCEFLGMTENIKFNDAVEFINPSPTAYTQKATPRIQSDTATSSLGYVDILKADRIMGWGLSTVDTMPLEIELRVNGIPKQTVVADLPRPDVAAANPRFHENCGFVFEFSKPDYLKTGDRIEVYIAKENSHLTNSPQTFVES